MLAGQGCLYNILLGVNGRLSHSCRKWALKALVHFASDRMLFCVSRFQHLQLTQGAGNYRLRIGEGGLSSFIKTTIKNPKDDVKAPAVTILAFLASNDSYRCVPRYPHAKIGL